MAMGATLIAIGVVICVSVVGIYVVVVFGLFLL